MLEPAVSTPPAFAIARPQPGEYAPYYDRYISLVPGEDILNTIDQQRRQTMLLLSGRDDGDGDFRYAPGKWSADGKRVLYSHGTGEVFEMDIRESADGTLEAGQPRMLALIGNMWWTDVARDGRLLMTRTSNSGTVVITNWLALRNKEAVTR